MRLNLFRFPVKVTGVCNLIAPRFYRAAPPFAPYSTPLIFPHWRVIV